MSLIKYRVHEIGKDFDVKSKDIMDILAKYSVEPKNHMAILTEKELNIIFEVFTTERKVENFDGFFATFALAREKIKEKHEAEKKLQNEEEAKKRAESGLPPKPPVKQEKKQSGEIQKTIIEKRYVDTRTVNVDLTKYDGKVDRLVPDKVKDIGSQMQKLKKTSNYRPLGTKRDISEAEKLKKIEQAKAKKPQLDLVLPEQIAVSDLASRLWVTNAQIVKKLMILGIMASASQMIDYDTASLIAEEFGAKVSKEVIVTIEDRLIDDSVDNEEDLKPRGPVVVVMGHVDHGKTSLLDAIRNTNVTSTEAGGITQHIGAYRINVKDKEITFLDTPGHAAFTAMRARGAQVTDVAILVVAADDGIMPQTVEAIDHAKAAGVPIIIAINKMDKAGANPDKIMQELTQYELVPEQWGGDTICVPVSAVKNTGIDSLLETIILVTEIKELKANPSRSAKGTVIEAKLDKGRGPVATVLVQNGTLKAGDCIIAGSCVGRVRAMTDDKGKHIKSAGPSVPVEITGLSEVPRAGDLFYCVDDERMARELAEQRKFEEKEVNFKSNSKVSLEDLYSRIQEGEIKDLNIIIKADVHGSVEAIRSSLEKLSNDEVRVRVIHGSVGAINDTDVMLAYASNAILIGFNVRPDPNARITAQQNDVDIRLYRIIYECIEEIQAALKGMLTPKYKEVVLGHAQVRQVFKITGAGTIAGCYITDGKFIRSANVRIVRDGIVVIDSKISTLKRFKDDVKEVAEGYECGISIERYDDIKEGDEIEAFEMEEID